MMTRIFGAALIISGAYLIGNVWVQQGKKRLKVLSEICSLLEMYCLDLKRYRRSLFECLRGKGKTAELLLEEKLPQGLVSEDQKMLLTLLKQLKNCTYKRSVEVTEDALKTLQSTIKRLKEEAASQGKALPLVTGAIGFLIAVLLF